MKNVRFGNCDLGFSRRGERRAMLVPRDAEKPPHPNPLPRRRGRWDKPPGGIGVSPVSSHALQTPNPKSAIRNALTLTELLVVVVIVLMLTVATVRIMRPAVEKARIREAARGVSTFLSAARSRAIETGRPVGVVLQRLSSNEPSAATDADFAVMTLRVAEVPPPYAGDALNSTVTMRTTSQPSSNNGYVQCEATVSGWNPELVSRGDLMQVNNQGRWYTIMNEPQQGNPLTLQAYVGTGQVPWPETGSSSQLPFTIMRRPVSSAAADYQLPGNMAIDLAYSGVGLSTWQGNVSEDVAIIFAPDGRVEGLYLDGAAGRPQGDIYLFVGKRELVATAPQIADPANLWVAIGSQSGQTMVFEHVDSDIQAAREWIQQQRGNAMGGS